VNLDSGKTTYTDAFQINILITFIIYIFC